MQCLFFFNAFQIFSFHLIFQKIDFNFFSSPNFSLILYFSLHVSKLTGYVWFSLWFILEIRGHYILEKLPTYSLFFLHQCIISVLTFWLYPIVLECPIFICLFIHFLLFAFHLEYFLLTPGSVESFLSGAWFIRENVKEIFLRYNK